MTALEKLKKAEATANKTGAEALLLANLMGALQTMAETPGTLYDPTTIGIIADIADDWTTRNEPK